MAENRTVTVSITINLGNYENLRLEVCDKAETKEEADELRRFLADVLDGYGNNNATAKSAIDKYKARILADSCDEPADAAYSFTADEPVMPFFGAEETEEPAEELPLPEPFMAEPFLEEAEVEEPAPVFEPVAVPQAPASTDAEFTCSKCGAPVTKLQREVSMLFNHKILCKDCMK